MLINGLYAKHDELSSLNKNRAWILIKNSKDIKVIGFRWLFIKRMVLRIIFSPVVRIIFSLIFQFDLLLKQIDTKLTFFMMTQIRNLYETISHKVFLKNMIMKMSFVCLRNLCMVSNKLLRNGI